MTFPTTWAVDSERVDRPSFRWQPTAIAFALMALGAVYLASTISGRQASLFLVGALAGIVLYHAAFGFTSSWRALIVDARGRGVRAQMLMLAVTCLVFFPVLSSGHFFGQAVRGSVSPLGIGVLVGAFLFGVGMQLGGGCASGTLYSASGGDLRMVVTLIAFIAGAVLGSAHLPWWEALPGAKAISLLTTFGVAGGLAISLAAFAAVAAITVWVERRWHGSLEPAFPLRIRGAGAPGSSMLRGPWPVVAGAIGLAAVNVLTLALAGRPWGITGALSLWGTKMLATVGVPVESWRYFAPGARRAELHASVLTDITSVMNFGIMIGAATAATLAGRFSPALRASGKSVAAAVVGGLLLGYGARIAYGCNIGAFFSGIASGSVHGWIWFPCALAGNFAGTRLRPWFGLRM